MMKKIKTLPLILLILLNLHLLAKPLSIPRMISRRQDPGFRISNSSQSLSNESSADPREILRLPTPPWRNVLKRNEVGVDLMFVIGGSDSINYNNSNNFINLKAWVVQVASGFDISRDNVRIGVVQFSYWYRNRNLEEQKYIRTEVALGSCGNTDCLEQAIQGIRLLGYTTYAGAAINKTVKVDFATSPKHSKKVIVLVTDQPSHDDVRHASAYARSQNVTLFSVGVGGYSLAQLQLIANGQLQINWRVYTVNDFNSLRSITGDLQSEIKADLINPACTPLITPLHGTLNCSNANEVGSTCQYRCHSHSRFTVRGSAIRRCDWMPGTGAIWTGVPATCGVCTGSFDLLILLDTSASIPPQNFNIIKDFLIRFVDAFQIGCKAVQVSLLHRSGNAVVARWNYNWFLDRKLLRTELFNLPITNSCIDNRGLAEAVRVNFRRESGRRLNSRHITVVVTDGTSSSDGSLLDVSRQLQLASKVIAIGLNETDSGLIDLVASDPDYTYSLPLGRSYLELFQNLESVVAKVCEAKQSIASTTCPKPLPSDGRGCNPTLICTNSNKAGSVCKARCCRGFEIRSNPVFICQYNGQWSQTRWQCTEKSCTGLSLAEGSGVTCSNSNRVGSTCVVSCKSGYVTSRHHSNANCQRSLETGKLECVATCQRGPNDVIPKWTSPVNVNCVEINECESMPCQNNGSCVDRINGFLCHCPPGYGGETCQTNIDDCATSPCLNSATCVDGVNHFSCTCRDGFTGRNCETNIDDCQPQPCLNNATCEDSVNDYFCVCPSGFQGKDCEVVANWCDSLPCSNGGTCLTGDGEFECRCPTGFTGQRCQVDIDDCQNITCVNGRCVDGVNRFTCECFPGFVGMFCENNENHCLSGPCPPFQRCLEETPPELYRCVCPEGFEGDECEINLNECDPDPCKGKGNCTDLVNGFRCSCRPGYTGPTCQIDVDECQGVTCHNGGICRNRVAAFECECGPGYSGTLCDVIEDNCLIGSNEKCRNGGTCRNRMDGYSCDCTRGYTGELCEEEIRCPVDRLSTGSQPGSTCIGSGEPGTVCTLRCPPGTRPKLSGNDEAVNRTCSDSGYWTVTDELWQCNAVTCKSLDGVLRITLRNSSAERQARPPASNDTLQRVLTSRESASSETRVQHSSTALINCSNGHYVDSVCQISCPPEHRPIGAGFSVCRENGEWSLGEVTCERYQCPLFKVSQGVMCTNHYRLGSTCNKTCPRGYQLRGPMLKSCSESFTWIPQLPWECVPVCDGFPPETSNAIYECSRFNNVGSVCTSTCNRGFVQERPAWFNCTTDSVGTKKAKWKGNIGVCRSSCRHSVNLDTGEFYGFTGEDGVRLEVTPYLPTTEDLPQCAYKAVLGLRGTFNSSITIDLSYSIQPRGYHLEFASVLLSNNTARQRRTNRIVGLGSSLFTSNTNGNESTFNSFLRETRNGIFQSNASITVTLREHDALWNISRSIEETAFTNSYIRLNRDSHIDIGLNRLVNGSNIREDGQRNSGLCFVCVNTSV